MKVRLRGNDQRNTWTIEDARTGATLVLKQIAIAADENDVVASIELAEYIDFDVAVEAGIEPCGNDCDQVAILPDARMFAVCPYHANTARMFAKALGIRVEVVPDEGQYRCLQRVDRRRVPAPDADPRR